MATALPTASAHATHQESGCITVYYPLLSLNEAKKLTPSIFDIFTGVSTDNQCASRIPIIIESQGQRYFSGVEQLESDLAHYRRGIDGPPMNSGGVMR